MAYSGQDVVEDIAKLKREMSCWMWKCCRIWGRWFAKRILSYLLGRVKWPSFRDVQWEPPIGVTTTIHKEWHHFSSIWKKVGKKTLNWRPLTLLGVDLKILAKAIFLRQQEVIERLVRVEQTCVAPGRSMSENLAIIRDLYLNGLDRNVCIAGLDFAKAWLSKSRTGEVWVRPTVEGMDSFTVNWLL